MLAFAVAAAVDPSLGRFDGPRALSEPEKGEILLTLARYDSVYQDFFARGGSPELLDEFPASKLVRHQVFRDVGFLRDAGLLQVHDLARAILLDTRYVGGGLAEATVFEEWNHVLEKAVDRAPRSKLAGFGHGFRYRLQRSPRGWTVIFWEPVDVPPPDEGEPNAW